MKNDNHFMSYNSSVSKSNIINFHIFTIIFTRKEIYSIWVILITKNANFLGSQTQEARLNIAY